MSNDGTMWQSGAPEVDHFPIFCNCKATLSHQESPAINVKSSSPYTNFHHIKDLLVIGLCESFLLKEKPSQWKKKKSKRKNSAVCEVCVGASACLMWDFWARDRQDLIKPRQRKCHTTSRAQTRGSGKAFPVMTLSSHKTKGFGRRQLKDHDLVKEIQCTSVWIWATRVWGKWNTCAPLPAEWEKNQATQTCTWMRSDRAVDKMIKRSWRN